RPDCLRSPGRENVGARGRGTGCGAERGHVREEGVIRVERAARSMAAVKAHYDGHLGPVYAWMVGGTALALERGEAELEALGVHPSKTGVAVDLGAGFGMHSVPLARRGYEVVAIDCSTVMVE